jgi:PKD repeat protein
MKQLIMNKIKTLTFAIALTFLGLNTQAQTVTTFAGVDNSSNPTSNFDNTTTTLAAAKFFNPQGLGWDDNGKMYIVEQHKVRVLNGNLYIRSGSIGEPSFAHGYANATGIKSHFNSPMAVEAAPNSEMYILDSENHCIRKITKFVNAGNGQISSTFVGAAPKFENGTSGFTNGTGTAARFDTPKGMTKDANGNLYVTDNFNYAIRKITPAGVVTTLAGNGTEGTSDGSSGASTRFGGPWGIAMLDANHVVVCDNWNSSIRKVNITTGETVTLCGKKGENWHKDGSLGEARFSSPRGVTVANGLIYIADYNTVRVIDLSAKTVSTFAGDKDDNGTTNGTGTAAKFGILEGIVYDGQSSLYVTDVFYHQIRKISINDLAPTVDFSATKTSVLTNEEVTITDISTGKPATSRTWIVKNLAGSQVDVTLVNGDYTGTKDITVKFGKAGFYTVSLEVTNEFGNDMKEKNSYINVSTESIDWVDMSEKITVFPNPNKDGLVQLLHTSSAFQDAEISVLNMQGQVVLTKENVNGRLATLEAQELVKGMYIIQIKNGETIATKSLMLQ